MKLWHTHRAAPGKVRKTYVRAAGAPEAAIILRCLDCDWGCDYKAMPARVGPCPRCGGRIVEGER